METGELIPHLFRTEYRKIVSVLCKRFGVEYLDMAEDVTSDTFLTAVQAWGLQGIPANPSAWLYQVARNKALNQLKRQRTFEQKVKPVMGQQGFLDDIDLSPQNMIDSQLEMMFVICHPCIPVSAQIGLALRILCGFGLEEIASAFLTNKETIHKRLSRAKERLRGEQVEIRIPGSNALATRVDAVLMTIYLLFNEGYYSQSQDSTLRKELCWEAMRLCTMLIEHPSTNLPVTNALMALMCFHASRFDARLDPHGEIVLYEDQDCSLWNTDLISKGGYFLHTAMKGETLSRFHLEAAIAYWNTQKEDNAQKWEEILQYYNELLMIAYSPMAALNRTYALSKVRGCETAIREAEKLRLTDMHLYYALLGKLYEQTDELKAVSYYETAIDKARTAGDKQALSKQRDRVLSRG
jgi:RNA polymerase sigma factor (sigma-70 family)